MPIAGLGVFQQIEGKHEELSAGGQSAAGVDQLPVDLGALDLDFGQFPFEFVLGPVRVVQEIQVAVFLSVESLQAVGQLLASHGEAGLFQLEQVVEFVPDLGLEVGAQADAAVVTLRGPSDVGHGQVRQIALALLAASAEKVEIGAAVAMAWCQDEAASTAGAPQDALEVVVVEALTGVPPPAPRARTR